MSHRSPDKHFLLNLYKSLMKQRSFDLNNKINQKEKKSKYHYLHTGEMVVYLNKLESPSPKDALGHNLSLIHI